MGVMIAAASSAVPLSSAREPCAPGSVYLPPVPQPTNILSNPILSTDVLARGFSDGTPSTIRTDINDNTDKFVIRIREVGPSDDYRALDSVSEMSLRFGSRASFAS